MSARATEVKGTAVLATPEFVRHTYGLDSYAQWIAALPPASKEIFASPIVTGGWYPLVAAFADPTKVMCEQFFDGNRQGAWEVGRYSADSGLRGIYRVFIKFGSPGFLIDRAGKAFNTYYRPGAAEAVERSDKGAILRISELVDLSGMVEYRIAGWCQRALELSGARKIEIDVKKSPLKGDPLIEIGVHWA